MSYRSGPYSEYPQHHPHDHGRASPRRPASSRVAVAPSLPEQDGYTLVHAGKQVRFGPVVFWIVVGTVTVLGMWSAATATYFAFRDDVLTRLIARQAEMQYAYEDRIAELRAKVDRTTSRQLLDQEQFDQKLDQIMRRQTTLESRATALGTIPDATVTGSIRMPSRGAGDAAASGTPKPSPISDTVIFVAPPDREARLESRAPVVVKRPAEPVRQGQGIRQRSGPSAELARQGRGPPDRGAEFGRREHGIAHPPDARRHHRSRTRYDTSGSRDPALRRRRSVRSAQAARECRRVRTPALPDQYHPRPGRSSQPNAGAGAVSQARDRRSRVHQRFRDPQRSVPRPPRDAYRAGFPRRFRRPGARHREWKSRLIRMGGRLRPHGRNRPRQRPVDPLRASVGDQRQGRRRTSRSDR